jgi:hypothetical protein
LAATYVIGQKTVYEMSVDEKTHKKFSNNFTTKFAMGQKHAKTVAIKKLCFRMLMK